MLTRLFFDRHMKRQGFTLIELTIVIVIIGILTVFATQGRTLIYEAKIRAAADAFSSIENNIAMFYSSHGKPPGDFRDLYLEHLHDKSCKPVTTLGDGETVYAGNNNGTIEWGPPRATSYTVPGASSAINYNANLLPVSNTPSAPTVPESFAVWCHLYLDGLLNKRFVPASNSIAHPATEYIPGVNAPNDKLTIGNYFVFYDNFIYMNDKGAMILSRPTFMDSFDELNGGDRMKDVWGNNIIAKPPYAHVIMAANMQSVNASKGGNYTGPMAISHYKGVYSGAQAMALTIKAASLAPGTSPQADKGAILVGTSISDDTTGSVFAGCVTYSASEQKLRFDTSTDMKNKKNCILRKIIAIS